MSSFIYSCCLSFAFKRSFVVSVFRYRIFFFIWQGIQSPTIKVRGDLLETKSEMVYFDSTWLVLPLVFLIGLCQLHSKKSEHLAHFQCTFTSSQLWKIHFAFCTTGFYCKQCCKWHVKIMLCMWFSKIVPFFIISLLASTFVQLLQNKFS